MSTLKEFEQNAIKMSHWSFFGCYMQQTPNAVLSLNRLLNAYNFDTIIELGTHDGGLSSLFALYCYGSQNMAYSNVPNEPSLYKNNTHNKKPKKFYTFDYVSRDIPRINFLKSIGTEFKEIDFLNNEENIKYIQDIIKNGGATLVLCDGGNKPKEFSLFSPSLKQGDVIMAHDWAFDKNAFSEIQKRGIWYGLETEWEQIKESCFKNNIKQICADEFDDSVWFCGLKQ
jgi:hypothetical protein